MAVDPESASSQGDDNLNAVVEGSLPGQVAHVIRQPLVLSFFLLILLVIEPLVEPRKSLCVPLIVTAACVGGLCAILSLICCCCLSPSWRGGQTWPRMIYEFLGEPNPIGFLALLVILVPRYVEPIVPYVSLIAGTLFLLASAISNFWKNLRLRKAERSVLPSHGLNEQNAFQQLISYGRKLSKTENTGPVHLYTENLISFVDEKIVELVSASRRGSRPYNQKFVNKILGCVAQNNFTALQGLIENDRFSFDGYSYKRTDALEEYPLVQLARERKWHVHLPSLSKYDKNIRQSLSNSTRRSQMLARFGLTECEPSDDDLVAFHLVAHTLTLSYLKTSPVIESFPFDNATTLSCANGSETVVVFTPPPLDDDVEFPAFFVRLNVQGTQVNKYIGKMFESPV